MFGKCKLLNDIASLTNWNVSKGENFSFIFSDCSKLSYISHIKKWDVSNGQNFKGMFYNCPCSIDSLKDWNISQK